jgi:hypothetical protein
MIQTMAYVRNKMSCVSIFHCLLFFLGFSCFSCVNHGNINDNCFYPCYEGIEPGKHNFIEFFRALPHILKADEALDVEYFTAEDRSHFSFYWIKNSTGDLISFRLTNGRVNRITTMLSHPIRLEDAIETFGEPTYSYIHYTPPVYGTSILPPEYGRLKIDYIFPEKGIILSLDEFILDIYGVTAICEEDPIIAISYLPRMTSHIEFMTYAYNLTEEDAESFIFERAPFTGESGWRYFDARLALTRDNSDLTRFAGYDEFFCNIKQRIPYNRPWSLPENHD